MKIKKGGNKPYVSKRQGHDRTNNWYGFCSSIVNHRVPTTHNKGRIRNDAFRLESHVDGRQLQSRSILCRNAIQCNDQLYGTNRNDYSLAWKRDGKCSSFNRRDCGCLWHVHIRWNINLDMGFWSCHSHRDTTLNVNIQLFGPFGIDLGWNSWVNPTRKEDLLKNYNFFFYFDKK